MKYKKYILITLCIIAAGCYLLFKDKKESPTDVPINAQAQNTEKPQTNTEGPANTSTDQLENENKPKKTDVTMIDTIPNKVGNSSGNLQNIGFAAQQGKWMFYTIPDTRYPYPLFRAMLDGETGIKTLTESQPMSYINVVGEWIYYINKSDEHAYRIKTDGTEKKLIINDQVTNLVVVEDYIYYTTIFNGIFKTKTDGSSRELITSERPLSTLLVQDNTIYYDVDLSNNKELKTALFKINTDGTNRSLISYDLCTNITVQENWIYYINGSDNSTLYKIKKDGTSRAKVLDAAIIAYNISVAALYYVPLNDFANLYKMNIDGGKKINLTNNTGMPVYGSDNVIGSITSINIIDDNIFCLVNTNGKLAIIRVSSDGSLIKFLN